MVDSEIVRAKNLLEQGGGSEVTGCLQRARELMGVLESNPTIPERFGPDLLVLVRMLGDPSIIDNQAQIGQLHERLFQMYTPAI